jgi:hypothetical protein
MRFLNRLAILVPSLWLACAAAYAQSADHKQGPRLDFRVEEFKTSLGKYKVDGRGIVRLNGAQFKDKIIALRVRYKFHVRNEGFSTTEWSSVVLVDGAGILETSTFPPDVVMESLRSGKAHPTYEWAADGWYLLNPATISPQ